MNALLGCRLLTADISLVGSRAHPACARIPGETHVWWFLRNVTACCLPQSMWSQPLGREPQSCWALLWRVLMLSAAVRLPGIQDRGRLWAVPPHRLQGIILFWCLGLAQLEESSGSCVFPWNNQKPGFTGGVVDSVGRCFCSEADVAVVSLTHTCLQGGMDRVFCWQIPVSSLSY